MELNKTIDLWLERAVEDGALAAEINSFKNSKDNESLYDSFYRSLSFGTGGLRGIIGAGSNRMNIYTVCQATQGLADYINESAIAKRVAIAYDSRINSELFARQAAAVFAANGIECFIYPRLMPTPALSFAVRHHGCGAGVCITASHNPAKYNGYKVYNSDGCQITDHAAAAIQEKIKQVDIFDGVKKMPFEEGLEKALIKWTPEETVDAYLDAVYALRLEKENSGGISVVYSPLNGAGLECVSRILKMAGVENISVVPQQEKPDGNFPTCPYPNPEEKAAMELGLAYAAEKGADLLLATDPDCDRVGIAVKKDDGYQLLTGNEIGVLLLDYICRRHRENGTMPKNPLAIKTIVTSSMADEAAKAYGVELRNVLTGFKYIGEQIGLMEKQGKESSYIFGFEESCGYLSGSHVRDKDGVNASLLICDMAQYYKKQGLSLAHGMAALYAKYGSYVNGLDSFEFEGEQGFMAMQALMKSLRDKPFSEIGNSPVDKWLDYLWSGDKKGEGFALPSSDVLQFILSDNSLVTVRPSGTEPKLKVYYSVKGKSMEISKKKLENLRAFMGAAVREAQKQ